MCHIIKSVLLMLTLTFSFANAAAGQDLTLANAKKATERARTYAMKKNWSVTIAVVNAEGNLVYFERGDGSYSGSIEMAINKAKSSAAFQRPTSAFVEAVGSGRTGLLSGASIIAIEGGVPLKINGKFVGAIGVSGAKSTEDEEAAIDGSKAL